MADRRSGWNLTWSAAKKQNTMNALTRWNPVRELEEFQNRILTAFRPVAGRYQDGNDSLTSVEWAPSVSISEDEKEYRITAEVPGVKPEDVKVTMENGTLSITGERRLEREDKNVRHHLTERVYGRFMRSFSLPGDSDPSQVDAQFRDGLLSIRIAKSEMARPKQIEIKVAA
ncbi:MAG: heat shock protein Hsp20 [Verrucomicrobiales bacterium]|nr:heat shock protein Hsp20 [Verrucomicrobiales bacterium]